MAISSYQIQNIIRTYNQQLKARLADAPDAPPEEKAELPKDVVELSNEGRKTLMMERAGTDAIRDLKKQALEPLKR